jgi:hypothetical protein
MHRPRRCRATGAVVQEEGTYRGSAKHEGKGISDPKRMRDEMFAGRDVIPVAKGRHSSFFARGGRILVPTAVGTEEQIARDRLRPGRRVHNCPS